ncbi:MAG TPA: type I-E CRISPR-associated protein Cse2/CasB [Myxococcales bacterium]|nr:type I-E CRISPR-associated protein Cse2/CasB [Myxococcales bacterium]
MNDVSPAENLSERLVARLERIASPDTRDRAALARLRKALHSSRRLEALPVVIDYVEPSHPRDVERLEDAAILLAGLFALHPVHRRGHSLARALAPIAESQGGNSVEERFRALLSASTSELPVHLRHAVSLVRSVSPGTGIDYVDLHWAIRGWDHDEGASRRRWARDFWAGAQNRHDSDAQADA